MYTVTAVIATTAVGDIAVIGEKTTLEVSKL